MPRVFDCTTYFNEDRLFELRLETLRDVVDVFVVVEATRTHTGRPKPIRFDPSRFPGFEDRIRHVVIDDLVADRSQAWENESAQRNAIVRGLDDAERADRVIIADIDEIPHPDAVRRYSPFFLIGTFEQRFFSYLLNNLAVKADDRTADRVWPRCKITTAGHLRGFFRNRPQEVRIFTKRRTPAGLLWWGRRKLFEQRLRPGGWHFAWAMTPTRMIEKIESYAHTETDREELKSIEAIERAIREGRDILGKSEYFRLITVDGTFPKPLQDQPERWSDLMLKPD